jgi:hypothetical protein
MTSGRSATKLDNLPMFANDNEIAEAIVGKKAAKEFVTKMLPSLERLPGFPVVDSFHGGRPVILVRMFYEKYLRLPDAPIVSNAASVEDPTAWKKSRRKA